MKRVLFPRPGSGRVRFLIRVAIIGALVALVTLGWELASGPRASSAPTSSSWSGHSLTFMVKDIDATPIDQPPLKKDSLGDMRVGHSHLYNVQGTQLEGRADFVYTLTDTAAKPGTIAAKAALTFTFAHGTVEAAGLSYRSTLSALPPDDLYAITGGTGNYRGAAGQVRLQLRNGVLFYTFSFA